MSASVRSLSYADGPGQERAVRSLDEAGGFEHFYTEHAPRVRQVARRHLWGPVVDDVVQETFTQAFRSGLHLERDDESVPVGDLLAGIARNRSIDVLRTRMRGLDEIADDGRVSALAAPASDADPERWLLASRRREGIAEALDSLCERQRRVMVMRYVEGRGYAEIAAAERITVSAVKATLSRGRRSFRHLYTAIAEREGLSVVIGGGMLRRLHARLRWARERVASLGSNAAGGLATASPAITQALVTVAVAGTVAVVGAAMTHPDLAPEPVAHTSEAPPEDRGERGEGDGGDRAQQGNAESREASSGAGRPEGAPSPSPAGQPDPPPRSAAVEHSQSVDSDEVAPVEEPPARAGADGKANAGVDDDGRARSEQEGDAESESEASKTKTAAHNELEAVGGGIEVDTSSSNALKAGCNVDPDGTVTGAVCPVEAPRV